MEEKYPKISRKAVQAVTHATRAIGHNNIIKRATEIYRKKVQVINNTTITTSRNSNPNINRISHRNHHKGVNTQKLRDLYDRSYHQQNTTTPCDKSDQ